MNSRYKKKIHLFEWLIIIDYYIRLWLLYTICMSFKLKISSFYYLITNFSDVEKLRSSVLISFPVFYSRNITSLFYKALTLYSSLRWHLKYYLNFWSIVSAYIYLKFRPKTILNILSVKNKYEDRWQIRTI